MYIRILCLFHYRNHHHHHHQSHHYCYYCFFWNNFDSLCYFFLEFYLYYLWLYYLIEHFYSYLYLYLLLLDCNCNYQYLNFYWNILNIINFFLLLLKLSGFTSASKELKISSSNLSSFIFYFLFIKKKYKNIK